MKAISFLGTGKYSTVTYCWEGQDVTTHLFPEAVARFFSPQRLLLLVTPQAKEARAADGGPTYLETLRERLGQALEVVDIPEGRSEQELWEVFSTLSGLLGEGDEVVLDVTHAYRSLPLVVFATALYLARARGVKVARVVYGAYEAREPLRSRAEPSDRVPVFDLTPLLALVGWLEGVAFFLERGDALPLARRLQEAHARPYRAGQTGELPRNLGRLATRLESLSQALHLSRPVEVMGQASSLLPLLQTVGEEVGRWAPPFAAVLGRVRGVVEPLGHPQPGRLDREGLARQIRLIRRYIQWGQIAQAVLLAREWLVSWVALKRGLDWLNREARAAIEGDLNRAARGKREGGEGAGAEAGEGLPQEGAPDIPEPALRAWSSIADLRNQVAHCGLSSSPPPAGWPTLQSNATALLPLLESLLKEASDNEVLGGRVVLDVHSLYGDTAHLSELPHYIERALAQVGEGQEVVLTGQGPIWLYLALAHAFHGKARRLIYNSPVTGEVVVFDHSSR